jgi:hypothetical protein
MIRPSILFSGLTCIAIVACKQNTNLQSKQLLDTVYVAATKDPPAKQDSTIVLVFCDLNSFEGDINLIFKDSRGNVLWFKPGNDPSISELYSTEKTSTIPTFIVNENQQGNEFIINYEGTVTDDNSGISHTVRIIKDIRKSQITDLNPTETALLQQTQLVELPITVNEDVIEKSLDVVTKTSCDKTRHLFRDILCKDRVFFTWKIEAGNYVLLNAVTTWMGNRGPATFYHLLCIDASGKITDRLEEWASENFVTVDHPDGGTTSAIEVKEGGIQINDQGTIIIESRTSEGSKLYQLTNTGTFKPMIY